MARAEMMMMVMIVAMVALLATPAASQGGRRPPATNTPTITARPPPAIDSTPRRSIVNPDFECGGAGLPGHSRTPRQAEDVQVEALAEDEEGGISSHCGVSIISDRFLLTAASCIDLNNPVSAVRLGDLDLAKKGENNSAEADYFIEEIIVFPLYKFESPVRYNDIALLKTVAPIQFNEAVFPLCISPSIPALGTTVVATGFGLFNETHKSNQLLEGELEVISLAECEQQYLEREEQRLRTAYPVLLQGQRGVLCAQSDKQGVCRGDEGGPLIREDESGRSFLEGITSFTGSQCSQNILPGVFTAVADYVPFIDDVLYGEIPA